MTARSLLFIAAAACGLAAFAASPVSARTVCDDYGRCFNTSGRPIYQPWRHYGYGYHPHRYWRPHYYRNGEY